MRWVASGAALAGLVALGCDGSPRDFDPDAGSGGQAGAGRGGSSQGGSSASGGGSGQSGAPTGGGSGGAAGMAGGGSGGADACGEGLTRCGAGCVDLMSDGDHCGECDAACGEDLVCQAGSCRSSCEDGLTQCGSSCVDLESNAAHCGGCSDACPAPTSGGNATCSERVCGIACNSGLDACQGECVDFETDAANCGGCGLTCSGVCLDGQCCPADRMACAGSCVDVSSSAQHCGGCGQACAAGQVCEGGLCRADCQNRDRCGNDCVDLGSDLANCGMCGTLCQPPARNGVALCTEAGCDISCNAGSLRCGTTCCDPAPANAAAVCQTGTCSVRCNTNYHACSGTTSPCYPDSDFTHCGSACTDCTQPNATAACVGGQCQNTCRGYTFPCTAVGGKPACGSWDFESTTPEGWTVTSNSTAFSNLLTTRTTRITSGFRALAVGFDGDGTDRWGVELRVRLCASGQAINLENRTLRLDLYAETASGTIPFTGNDAPAYFSAWNNGNLVVSMCDVQLSADSFQEVTCTFIDAVATDVSLLLRVYNTPWKGIFHIDNVRFE